MTMRSLLISCMLGLAACTANPVDHADPGSELEAGYETRRLAVSCDPKILAYPVLGPHNGGWDNNALDFTCPPHPGGSPDNSDWIPGDHYGNDIFAEKGELAVAPINGTVVKSGWNDVGGWRVTLQDACGWWYYSAHLDTIDPVAQLGAVLTAGTIIGTVGNSGSAQGTAPHIHFSIYPDGSYNSGVDPFPYLQAADGDSCDESVTPPPPASSDCPAGQSTKVCDGSYTLLTCVNGSQTSEESCAQSDAYCSELVGAQASCVSTLCTPSPDIAPQVGSAMCINGVRHLCDSQGWPQVTPCPAGLSCGDGGQCVDSNGPATDPECPATGKATLCNGATTYVSCGDGLKTGDGDCAIFSGVCLEVTAGEAACVDPLCAAPVNLAYVEHSLCVGDERVVCDATGWSYPSPCPQGQTCVGDGQCVAGPEGCEPEDERCNLLDDDCDGVIDESLPVVLGSPCPTNTPDCDAMGVWSCGPGEIPVCATDPALCPPSTSGDSGDPGTGGDAAGGIFSVPEPSVESPAPVTTSCASGPTPEVSVVLLVLWLMVRARRRERVRG